MKKTQISLEYMIVIGFVVFVLSGLIVLAYFYAGQARLQIKLSQIDKIGKKIIDNAESLYYLGEPSKTTLELDFPENIQKIKIENNEIIFFVNIGGYSSSEFVYKSNVNITGSIFPSWGKKYIVLEAKKDFVEISG